MTRHEIDAVLERVRTWSDREQEEAVLLLLALEERRLGVYELDEDEAADVEAGLAELERGELATEEEAKALFERYRR
jgi:predicted transcriptional regulator